MHDGQIIGTHRPWTWDKFEGPEAVRPMILDYVNARWRPLPERTWQVIQRGWESEDERRPDPIDPSWNESNQPHLEHMYIITRDGNLDIVVVAATVDEAVLAGRGCLRERVRKMAPDGNARHGGAAV